jgi:hypothetical protein
LSKLIEVPSDAEPLQSVIPGKSLTARLLTAILKEFLTEGVRVANSIKSTAKNSRLHSILCGENGQSL